MSHVDNIGGVASGIAGLGIVAIVLLLAIEAALIAIGIWITYTIIWRAVRRGLREFYAPGSAQGRSGPLYPPTNFTPPRQGGPRDW